ncbi:MAG: hypothetical protein AAF652_06355 [Cyanobacteria bacterium P01_C01_bin.72]
MSKNISITVDEQNLAYLDTQVQNRSKYINELIQKDRLHQLEASMREGYIAQSKSSEIKEEDLLWEIAIADGIEDED